jgi:DNA-binding MarR family transcriptional regulator
MKIEEILKSKKEYDLEDSVMLNIMYNAHMIASDGDHLFKLFGITSPQYNVLRILRGSKNTFLNLFEIQERMLKQMSNTTRIIDKLVLKEFAVRHEDPENRRKVQVAITQKGLDLLENIKPSLDKHNKRWVKKLTIEEQKLLTQLLEKQRL